MGYFPFFTDIAGKRCVIAGGGNVARRKAEKLLPFSPEITVIAPVICEQLRAMPVRSICRSFQDSDLDGAFMAIAATDDPALNHRIYIRCTERHIHINSVDDAENCSFLFPALVQYPQVTVGICTGGQSPVFARYLRMLIDDELDAKTLGTAEILGRYRPVVHQMFGTAALRREALEAILDLCTLEGDLPDGSEIMQLLEKIDEHKNRNTRQ